jgi:hypothetical protein
MTAAQLDLASRLAAVLDEAEKIAQQWQEWTRQWAESNRLPMPAERQPPVGDVTHMTFWTPDRVLSLVAAERADLEEATALVHGIFPEDRGLGELTLHRMAARWGVEP